MFTEMDEQRDGWIERQMERDIWIEIYIDVQKHRCIERQMGREIDNREIYEWRDRWIERQIDVKLGRQRTSKIKCQMERQTNRQVK